MADDERLLLASLSQLLSAAGYRVRTARDGASALRQIAARRPDLVLLDVMMPQMDGFSVCRKIRAADSELPVLFLTACEDEESELTGFGCGADGYLAKTLSQPLFLARVAAALRRRSPLGTASFAFGSWEVRPLERAMHRAGSTCSLTEREVALLRLLCEHPREVISRDFLIAHCCSGDAVSDGALSVAVCTLREKLSDEGARLVTVHGTGYAYRPPEETP